MNDSEKNSIDYWMVAQSADDLREMIGALVSSLVADGFTDREARIIVAGVWAQSIPGGLQEEA